MNVAVALDNSVVGEDVVAILKKGQQPSRAKHGLGGYLSTYRNLSKICYAS